jgi:hypothetical protein
MAIDAGEPAIVNGDPETDVNSPVVVSRVKEEMLFEV